jgi:hypothetical protein
MEIKHVDFDAIHQRLDDMNPRSPNYEPEAERDEDAEYEDWRDRNPDEGPGA